MSLTSDKACLAVQKVSDYLYSHFKGAPKGIIFDCDGVLIDSLDANIMYYNLVRSKFGLPQLNDEQKQYCQMCTAAQAIEHIVPKALLSQFHEVMKDVSYARDIEPHISVSHNLLPMLHRLKPLLKLGVHTNRMGPVDGMFERLGLSGIFEPIITVRDAEPKPHPEGTLRILSQWGLEPHEILFIGDSPADKKTANAAKVPFLSYRNEELQEMGTCCDFSHLDEALCLLLD